MTVALFLDLYQKHSTENGFETADVGLVGSSLVFFCEAAWSNVLIEVPTFFHYRIYQLTNSVRKRL